VDSVLGPVYSQALANESRAQVADQQHLMRDAAERIQSLHDELQAIKELWLAPSAVDNLRSQ